MATYRTDELISSTDISKKFWTYLSLVNSWKIKKLWILKNNKIEAVILPWNIYEMLWDYIENYLEDINIWKEIKNRINTKDNDFVDGYEVLKEFDLEVV